MKLFLFLFISIICSGQSFFLSKHTFDETACTSLKPRAGTQQTTSPPFTIEIDNNVYQPEKTIRVTIRSYQPTDKFQGFYVEARKPGTIDPYGTWQTSSLVKTRDCKGHSDAITHADMTNRDSISLVWNPPTTNVGPLQIVATVMKDKHTYWYNLKSQEINWFRAVAPYPETSHGYDQQLSGHQTADLGQQTSSVESLVKIFDDASCYTLKPTFKVSPQTSPPPITITTDKQSYKVGDPILVTIDLKPNAATFRGFILQARAYHHSSDIMPFDIMPLGSFRIEGALNNAQTKRCRSINDTVVHKSWQITRKVQIYWDSPAQESRKIYFQVTVLQDFSIYWYKIESNALNFDEQTASQHKNYEQSIDQAPVRLIKEEGTCVAPCQRKYPIGTGRGVADLLMSVKQTLQKVEQMLQSRCAGPSECGDVQALGFTKSEIYSITPKGSQQSQDVFCDLETDDGGWLVFLRKYGQVEDNFFDRNWEDYKSGFGDLRGTFRLGNDLLSRLTRSAEYELRFDFLLTNGENKFAHYETIVVGDESSKYKLQLGSYNGNSGNIYGNHNSQPFSTKDRDSSGQNCAQKQKHGYWFHPEYCVKYTNFEVSTHNGLIELKIRPANFGTSPHSHLQQPSSGNPSDCADVQNRGFTKNAIYKIQITKITEPIDVYCDLTTDGGGWTVIARRNKSSSSLSFDRNWNEYKVGFGNPDGEYRMGNEKLYQLTITKSHHIRFDNKDERGQLTKYAEFNHFSIGSEVVKYRINIQGFSGTDTSLRSLIEINNKPFSTKDRDNDESNVSCAQKWKLGYWFTTHNCFPSDLLAQKQMMFEKFSSSNNQVQQSGSQQLQPSSSYEQSISQNQQLTHPSQQSSQLNYQQSQQTPQLDKIKADWDHLETKIRPVNFKQKLQESKYGGGSKKTTGSQATDLPKNCAEVQYKGNENSGLYNIRLLGTTVEVYCDLVTDGGGWVVFKRMWSESKSEFSRTWTEYQRGFGNRDRNFYLGLDKISALTKQDPSEFRLDIDDGPRYTTYSSFLVGDESTKYKLTLAGYSGTFRDVLSQNNGQPFSTKDRDNDGLPENCAVTQGHGNWFGPTTCKYGGSSRIDKLVASPDESSSEPASISLIWKGATKVEGKIRLTSYKSQQCCKS